MIKKTIGIIPRNLIKNIKRTAAIAVSIILSIVLITSMEILIRSVISASVESNGKLLGKYHALYRNISYKDLNVLTENEKVDKVGTTALMGSGKNGDYQIELNGIDSEAINLLNIELYKGELPEKEGEIVIEKWILDKVYQKKKIGDKIVIPCQFYKRSGENSKEVQNIEFTLVGIINNLMGTSTANSGKAYLSMEGAQKIIMSENLIYYQYFTLKDNYPVQSTLESFNDEYGKKSYEINYGYMRILNMAEKSIYIIVIMDIIIAIIASIMIYNIFNMSIIERIKQFGLLKSIGITSMQIKGIVMGEGILLGVICIPTGIFLGVNIVKLLLIIIGGLGNKKLIVDSNTYNIWFITLVGFSTIIKSAIKPAKLAANVSTIEALNIDSGLGKEDIKNQRTHVKAIRILFGYTGMMAFMNLSRNKKRFIATVMSISMGVTIFLSINYFIGSVDPVKVVENNIESDYVLKITSYEERVGYSSSEVNEIDNMQGVEKVEKYKFVWVEADLKRENMTEDGIKEKEERARTDAYTQSNIKKGIYSLNADIIGCSKETIEKIREDLKKDTFNNSMNNDGQSIFIVQNINNKQLCNLKPGDKVDTTWSVRGYPIWEKVKGSFFVEGILDEVPFKIGGYDAKVILITEESNIEKIFGLYGYQRIMVHLDDKTNKIDEVENKIEQIAKREKGRQIISYREDLETIKRNKFQVSTILYVLFITAALAALVNIVNTINMNVMTRKREFGMLRAIGMTLGQIKSMIIKEGLTYGLVGSIMGSILGIACSYLIFIGAKDSIIVGMEWKIHIGVIVIVLGVTIGITIISTLIPLKKATDMEIVESIRAIE